MYAVIFRAEINTIDDTYIQMANRVRELAFRDYGCIEFTSCTEGSTEIAISYWPSKKHIQSWKNNLEHQKAQELGKTKWYKTYQVQVVEVLHEYTKNT